MAPVILLGNGDGFGDVDFSESAGIALAVYKGRSNFIVYTIDADNQKIDLLFNAIGPYKGTVLFFSEGVRRLSVEAEGEWVISILPLPLARFENVPGKFSGENDDVVVLRGRPDTLSLVAIEKDNVIVYGYSDGERHLLVNEIGPYANSVLVPNDVYLMEIKITGLWEMEIK